MSDIKSERRFELFYRSLSFLAVYFIVTAFIVPIVTNGAGIMFAAFGIILVLMLTGYWFQAGWSAASRYSRPESTRSYEAEHKYYEFKRALPICIPALIIAYFGAKLTNGLLITSSQQTGNYYDPDSLLPMLAGIIAFVCVMLGSFVWFFPYERLTTGRSFFVGLTVLGVAFALTVLLGGESITSSAISCGGYAVCVIIAANQSTISKTYHGTVVAFMTPRTRRYNLALSLTLIAILGVITFIAYLICNGVRVIVRFMVFTILNASNIPEEGYFEDERDTVYTLSNLYLYGTQEARDSANYWLFLVFCIVFVIFLVYFIFRRASSVRALIARLKDWLLWIFDSFFHPMIDFFEVNRDEFYNYVDFEDKVQKKGSVREYASSDGKKRMSYRDFLSALRSRRNAADRYRFAYSTFVRQLRSMPTFVRGSDTPREISARLAVDRRYEGRDAEIGQITSAFEKIDYGGMTPGDNEEKALEQLCSMINENI